MSFTRSSASHILARASVSAFFALAATLAGCSSTPAPVQVPVTQVGSILVSAPSQAIEVGFHMTLTATVRSPQGTVINIPVVWRSLNEKVVTVDADGRAFAVDTGQTVVVATSLGVTSAAFPLTVVFTGPAKIETFAFTAPSAISPGATPDSIKAVVSNRNGNPISNARVKFTVTAGGGTITPDIVTTNAQGIAAAQWKLGAAAGVNTATATVLGEDDKVAPYAKPSSVTYSVRTFVAVLPATGNNQAGQILADLPVQPSVKVVDSLGKPRIGVPVTFSVSGGGRVQFTTVSTGADGTASPGVWTLGDVPGEQTLVATVELATTALKATGTGTPVYYTPLRIVAGGFATCGIEVDNTASCFGEEPTIGDGDTVKKFTPTPTAGGFRFTTLAGTPSSPSHFCGVSLDSDIYCWGTNAITDTTPTPAGATTLPASQSPKVPTKILTNFKFTDVAPGQAHNCAVGTDANAYCWGDNSQGQLGDRSIVRHNAPAIVFGGFKYASITSGGGHSCGTTLDGLGVCWGNNQFGQLGNSTTNGSASPTAVSGGLQFKTISAGNFFTCGLTRDGKAYCWGSMPGTAAGTVRDPKNYPDAPAFTQISSGGFHVCALTADGSAYCWGQNTAGQLGDSTTTERLNPTAVKTTVKFKSISAGYGHTCGNALDGSALCWGFNKAGELGDTLVAQRPLPRFIVLKVNPAAPGASLRARMLRAQTSQGIRRP